MQKKRSRHSSPELFGLLQDSNTDAFGTCRTNIRLYKIQYRNSIQCSLSPRYSDVQGETEAKIEAHTYKAEASPSWSEMRPRYPKQGARPESVSTVHCILSVNAVLGYIPGTWDIIDDVTVCSFIVEK